MPIHGDLSTFAEVKADDYQFTKQNSKMLKVNLSHGPVQAKVGSMVGYQGQATFENKGSGGLGKMLKKAVTNEGVEMMEVNGTGELFLAHQGEDVLTLYIENDVISLNGASVLAFSSSISWDIQRVGGGAAGFVAGGLYNVTLSGTGWVALTTDGTPVMLDVSEAPTFADPQAAVMWSSGVQMQLHRDTTGGLKSFARGGTGETFQMAFTGQGFVLIQPSEGVPQGAEGSGSNEGSGGILGQLGI